MSDVGHEHPGISDEMANEQEIRRRNINSNSKGSIEDLNKSNDSENLINDYNTTDLQSASDSGGEKQGRGSGNDSDPADNVRKVLLILYFSLTHSLSCSLELVKIGLFYIMKMDNIPHTTHTIT